MQYNADIWARDDYPQFSAASNELHISESSWSKWKSDGFVVLNPHARFYGGIGNLFLGIIAVHFIALGLHKASVVNNQLFTSIFDYPAVLGGALNTSTDGNASSFTTVTPNLAWSSAKVSEVYKMQSQIKHFKCEQMSRNFAQLKALRFQGFHGVACLANAMKTSSLRAQYNQLLRINNTRTADSICRSMVSWMFSKLTLRAVKEMQDAGRYFTDHCPPESKIDLAIQHRTPDRGHGSMNEGALDCVAQCSLEKLEIVLSEKKKKEEKKKKKQKKEEDEEETLPEQQQKQGNACVFITGNNPVESRALAKRIWARYPETSILSRLSPKEGDKSDETATNSEAKQNPGHEETKTHTGDLVESTRAKDFVNPDDIWQHRDIVDWLLMGDATSAVFSLTSSFGSIARLRLGNNRNRTDAFSGDARYHHKDGNCSCMPSVQDPICVD